MNSFYTHARHRIIEATRRCKNCVLQNVPWSVGRSLSDVTLASSESPNQPIRRNQKCRRVFLKIPSKAENWESPIVGEVYLKCSANPLEALWSIGNSWRSCIKNRLKKRYNLEKFERSCFYGVRKKVNVIIFLMRKCVNDIHWICDHQKRWRIHDFVD